jgi:hypothetical protein
MTEEQLESGIFLPSGVAKPAERESATDRIFLPPGVGLDKINELPDSMAPPPEEKYGPEDFAKSSCKYCHGKGVVKRENTELRATEEVLCSCVELRLESGKGPRKRK